MEEVKRINFELFGQMFPLTTNDGTTEDLKKIAGYYKKIVIGLQKKLPNASHLNIAVLAGLMITDDLYNLSKDKNPNFSFEDKKVDELLSEALKQLELSLN